MGCAWKMGGLTLQFGVGNFYMRAGTCLKTRAQGPYGVQGKLLCPRTHFLAHVSLCVPKVGSQVQQVPKQAQRALFRVLPLCHSPRLPISVGSFAPTCGLLSHKVLPSLSRLQQGEDYRCPCVGRAVRCGTTSFLARGCLVCHVAAGVLLPIVLVWALTDRCDGPNQHRQRPRPSRRLSSAARPLFPALLPS